MKVSELIVILSKLKQDAEVMWHGDLDDAEVRPEEIASEHKRVYCYTDKEYLDLVYLNPPAGINE